MKPYFVIPLLLQKFIWIPTRLILWFFGHLEVRGLDNLRGIKTNVIFAPNHPSELDPILVPASLQFWSRFSPLFYTTREKEFYDTCGWRKHLFGGLFINLWGGYRVFVGMRDYEKSLPHHIHIVHEGGNLCFFPEGSKTSDTVRHVAKGGLAYLAEFTNRPIVPVHISGVYGMTVSDFFFRRRTISVHFGRVIDLEELKASVTPSTAVAGQAYKEAAQHVMQ